MKHIEKNSIYVGLKFTSVHFSDDAEIVAVRESANEVDVKLTTSEGHARVEKGWNLQHTKWGFERGEYKEAPKSDFNISVI